MTRDTLHDLRSVTKSVISALVGVASASGAIRSLDAPLPDPADFRFETGSIIAIALIASTWIGCAHARSSAAGETGGRQSSHADAIDHVVPHISTARANEGARVSLFMRERRRAPSRPVVLLVHGRAAAAPPSFDLEYRDDSWREALPDCDLRKP